MIRTLQLAAVHGWVSLRLTVSRGYWLPRLSMGVIAGYMLLFFSRHFDPLAWGPVVTSMAMGLSCFSVSSGNSNGQLLPLPLPRSWISTVDVIAQIAVCIGVALGFMMVDVATTYSILFGLDGIEIASHPISHLLSMTELKHMGIMVLASLPVGLSVVGLSNHYQQPRNAWGNRQWKSVLPPMVVVTVAMAAASAGAIAVEAPQFLQKYLNVWLGFSLGWTGMTAASYGWAALFPPSTQRTRTAKPAIQRLSATVWQSVAIKLAYLTVGLALYMVPPSVYLPEGWPVLLGQKARPLYICYAAFLPFFSMDSLTSLRSTVGSQQYMGWDWTRSGWNMVPAPRTAIQRALLVDMVGFAAVSSIALHVAVMLSPQSGVTVSAGLQSWPQDLSTFTWFYTMFLSIALPAFMLFFIPRRRFGMGLTVAAFAATFWGIRNGFFGIDADIAWTLPLSQHLITVSLWGVMAAVLLAQTTSPTGQLFEAGSPATRASRAAGAFMSSRASRWTIGIAAVIAAGTTIVMHRSAMTTEINRRHASRITAEQTDRLIRDLKHIAEIDVLASPTRSRDAGPLLNPHIGLDDGTPAQEVAWWDDIKHKKTLNKKEGNRWFDAPDDIEVGDLSLLTKLRAYDHWETGHVPTFGDNTEPPIGAYAEHLAATPNGAHLNHLEPLPNVVALFDLAKFRMLHGMRTNDLLSALEEVRHLAKLVYSDQTLIHTMVAIGMLRIEARAYRAAVERGEIEADSWTVVSEDDLTIMRRASMSLAYMMSGGANEAEWRRVAELPFEPFGLCAAIHEGMTSVLTQPSATLWPGEMFPQPNTGFIDHSIASSRCETPLARHDHELLRSDGKTRNREWHRLLAKEFDESTLLALTIPYLRGTTWVTTRDGMDPYGVLMYGETPEDDWNGYRVVHTGGHGSTPHKSK